MSEFSSPSLVRNDAYIEKSLSEVTSGRESNSDGSSNLEENKKEPEAKLMLLRMNTTAEFELNRTVRHMELRKLTKAMRLHSPSARRGFSALLFILTTILSCVTIRGSSQFYVEAAIIFPPINISSADGLFILALFIVILWILVLSSAAFVLRWSACISYITIGCYVLNQLILCLTTLNESYQKAENKIIRLTPYDHTNALSIYIAAQLSVILILLFFSYVYPTFTYSWCSKLIWLQPWKANEVMVRSLLVPMTPLEFWLMENNGGCANHDTSSVSTKKPRPLSKYRTQVMGCYFNVKKKHFLKHIWSLLCCISCLRGPPLHKQRCRLKLYRHSHYFLGEVDFQGRPHGFGRWKEVSLSGECFVGYWQHGLPAAPSILIENHSGSVYSSVRIACVIWSSSHQLTFWEVVDVECALSKPIYTDYPIITRVVPCDERRGQLRQGRQWFCKKIDVSNIYESKTSALSEDGQDFVNRLGFAKHVTNTLIEMSKYGHIPSVEMHPLLKPSRDNSRGFCVRQRNRYAHLENAWKLSDFPQLGRPPDKLTAASTPFNSFDFHLIRPWSLHQEIAIFVAASSKDSIKAFAQLMATYRVDTRICPFVFGWEPCSLGHYFSTATKKKNEDYHDEIVDALVSFIASFLLLDIHKIHIIATISDASIAVEGLKKLASTGLLIQTNDINTYHDKGSLEIHNGLHRKPKHYVEDNGSKPNLSRNSENSITSNARPTLELVSCSLVEPHILLSTFFNTTYPLLRAYCRIISIYTNQNHKWWRWGMQKELFVGSTPLELQRIKTLKCKTKKIHSQSMQQRESVRRQKGQLESWHRCMQDTDTQLNEIVIDTDRTRTSRRTLNKKEYLPDLASESMDTALNKIDGLRFKKDWLDLDVIDVTRVSDDATNSLLNARPIMINKWILKDIASVLNNPVRAHKRVPFVQHLEGNVFTLTNGGG